MRLLVFVDGHPLVVAALAFAAVPGAVVESAAVHGYAFDADTAGRLAAAGSRIVSAHNAGSPDVVVVSAEGRSPFAELDAAMAGSAPPLTIVVGGGVRTATELALYLRQRDVPAGRVVLLAGFPFVRADGLSPAATVAKRGLVAAFLDEPDPAAAAVVAQLLPHARPAGVAEAVLSAGNPFMHVPVMLLNAGDVDRGEQLGFYREAFTDSVARFIRALDAERLQIAAEFGFRLDPLEVALHAHYGADGMRAADLRTMVVTFPPYEAVTLPTTFDHRYLAHEVRSTLAPLVGIGELLNSPVESLSAAVHLAEILVAGPLGSDDVQIALSFLENFAPAHVSVIAEL